MNKNSNKYFKAEALFAAANSGLGFRNFFDELFETKNPEKIYIIKGGPGTGKSSFMRAVATYAEGKGMSAEYYYCSSDENSLDCVIIDDRIIFADGTAPHLMDMKIPGARDEIINLGEFWDADALTEKYAEIEEFISKKSNCYSKAYKYLSACMTLRGVNRDIILPAVRHTKLAAAVGRITKDMPQGKGFKLIPALTNGIGMNGISRFDTYINCAKKLYIVDDFCDTAGLYLGLLIKKAESLGAELRISYDPVDPSVPNAVYFTETGTAFVTHSPKKVTAEHSRINMKRFVNQKYISDIKLEYKSNARLADALIGSACEALAAAGENHFALEEIYINCMDFTAKEAFTKAFCGKLFG